MNRDTIIQDTTQVTMSLKKLKVQTPLGTIESDSGNHAFDVLTIVGVIFIVYIGKKFVDNFFQKYNWKCSDCGDTTFNLKQPYCKKCSHIERFDVKMEKLENK